MNHKRLTASLLCGLSALYGAQQLPAGAVSLQDEPFILSEASEPDYNLPERYDMRAAGLTTKVHRQGSTSVCWSFAAISALESTVVSRLPEVDFSEWSLAFYAFSPVFGYEKDTVEPFRSAGGVSLTAPLLTSWLGPVPQEDFPSSELTGNEWDLTADELRSQTVYHTTDIDIFMNDPNAPFTDAMQQEVKNAIWHQKAVAMIYYNEKSGYSADNCSFYNPDFNRAKAVTSRFHSAVIVGWDDTYSASHFNQAPSRDGAFLCKNSWGPSWGESGYFWISYDDPSFSQLYTVSGEPVQRHSGQFQYDTYGSCRSFAIESNDPTGYMANCFTAGEDTVLSSVMFVTAMPQENYTVTVYKHLTNAADPTSGTAAAVQSGTQPYVGYHTINLDEPVFLEKGEQFSIVVQLSGDAGHHISCEAYVRFTTEKSDGTVYIDSETLFPEELVVKDFHKGESFVSIDGKKWIDVYSYDTIDQDLPAKAEDEKRHVYGKLANVCVRGLTQELGAVQFSDYFEEVPEETAITLTCPGAEKILYSTDGADFVPYTEPIPIDAETEISACAVLNGRQYPVVSRHYRPAAAKINHILRQDTNEYLELNALTDDCYTAVCTRSDTELRLQPVSTADIYAGSAKFSSNASLRILEGNVIYLQAREEGKRDSLYVIYLTDVIKGNVNLDQAVNASDATEILIYAAKQGTGNAENAQKDAAWLDRADFNADGLVNASDASAILIYAAKKGTGRTDD